MKPARLLLAAAFALSIGTGLLRASQEPTPESLTFFAVSDTHYGHSQAVNEAVPHLVDKMNALPGTPYPPEIGGTVAEPRGVLHIGDSTNDGKPEQWAMFVRDYGLTGKDSRLRWPVHECYGNHDGGPDSPVRNGIRNRNTQRTGLLSLSPNKIHSTWSWNNILFINLGIAPGSTTRPYDPEFSMEFLENTLANLPNPAQPIILMHHFGFDKGHSLGWWTQDRRTRYRELLTGHNVIGILHGHAHQPFIYQWEGIDVYHPPHFRQHDPKNNGPVTHGFFVFKLTEKELVVAERRWDDSWGMMARKPLPAPPLPKPSPAPTPALTPANP